MINQRRAYMAVAALALACAVQSVRAGDERRFPTDRITLGQWQSYLDETLALPGAGNYESADQIIVEVPDIETVYVFTTPAHPAHPAVVKREVIQCDGAILIGRTGHYAGDRAAYDAWWRQFDALDQKIRDHVPDGS